MAATSVEINIRAIDNASRTIAAVEKQLRDLQRAGYSTGRGQRGPGGLILPTVDQRRTTVDRTHEQMQRTERNMRGNSGVMPFGLSPTMLGGLGVGLGGKEFVSQAANFEEQLSEIRKRGGLSEGQTEQVGKDILELATSGKVIASIDDIGKAYERAAAAGVAMQDWPAFAELSAKAADAFKMDAEAAANSIAFLSKNMKLSNGEIGEMLDLVNALGDAGTADESDILGFLNRSGAPLMTRGFKPQQIAAIGATMLNLGMDWETSARAINTTTEKLLNPASKQARKSLENLFGGKKGYQDFRKRFSKDGMAGLNEFMDKVGGLDNLDQLELIGDVVGSEFGPILQRLITARDELKRNLDLQANKESWFGGLDKSYDIKKSNFWSQWQLLKNEMASLTLDIGNASMPAMKEALQTAKGLVEDIGKGLEAFKATVDVSSLNEALTAVGNLRDKIGELMNVQPGDSPILKFFQDLANLTNGISETINLVNQLAGNGDPKETPEKTSERWEKFRKGIIDFDWKKPGWLDWLDGPDRPADDGQAERQRAQDEWLNGGPDINATPPDDLEQPVQTDPNAGKKLIRPSAKDAVRASMFGSFGGGEEAVPPVTADANLNVSAFMAGLQQLEAAAQATAARINATLSSIRAPAVGTGQAYGEAKRSQFSPSSGGGGGF